MEPIVSTNGGGSQADTVFDTSTATFERDVIQGSLETPVIVDFWAPWCGPCKQLTPALEQAVRATNGAVRLAKLNVDENQELAGHFRIQSIPAVYAFKEGRPVDGFVGALPDSQLKAFVDKLVGQQAPSPEDEALEMAKGALDAGQAREAQNVFAKIVERFPDNVAALAGLAQAALRLGEVEEARQALARVPADAADDADVVAARTALELAEESRETGDTADLRARLEANADDHQARYELAQALYGGGDAAAAIEELLELVRRNRAWDDDAARKQLVKIFEALGHTHELTVDGRRRLSSLLFS